MTRTTIRPLAFALLLGTALGGASGAHAQSPLPAEEPWATMAPAAAPVEAAPLAAAPAQALDDPAVIATPALPAADPSLAAAIAERLAATDPAAMAFLDKRRFAAVAAFYDGRAGTAAFVDADGPTDLARQVEARLRRANEDGLDPERFALPPEPVGTDPIDLAAFEVALARAVAAFAEEASGGRVAPATISKNITRKPVHVDTIAALRAVADGGDVDAVLDGFNPPHDGFRQLRAKLAEVRARPPVIPPAPIAAGPTLKPAMRDARVPLLRARLEQPDPLDPFDADLYDETLVDAVKGFQRQGGLLDDGIIGSRTLAVLNGLDRDEEGEILANMEMWRWMPRDLGSDYVLVNIPEFMVRVVHDGVLAHEARVVVGTPQNQTPVFSDEMEYLVVNPYWHVPESIKTKEMLPEIQADPAGYFQRHGYEAVWDGKVIDPATVLWDENAVKFVAIRQPPSEANALGKIKFMFPNQHAVYLHDTPSRKLFGRDYRAYSHGCVRVDDPMAFASAVLVGEADWTAEKLEALFGSQERRVDLSQHLKVHLAYFNVWVDGAGTLQMRDDLYGHSARIKEALGLSKT